MIPHKSNTDECEMNSPCPETSVNPPDQAVNPPDQADLRIGNEELVLGIMALDLSGIQDDFGNLNKISTWQREYPQESVKQKSKFQNGVENSLEDTTPFPFRPIADLPNQLNQAQDTTLTTDEAEPFSVSTQSGRISPNIRLPRSSDCSQRTSSDTVPQPQVQIQLSQSLKGRLLR